jgi:hypothetical protein
LWRLRAAARTLILPYEEEHVMAVLRVLSINGDDSYEYDPDVPDARLMEARAVFDAKVKTGHYLAFVPDASRRGGTQIRRFDPGAREIIVQPAIVGG